MYQLNFDGLPKFRLLPFLFFLLLFTSAQAQNPCTDEDCTTGFLFINGNPFVRFNAKDYDNESRFKHFRKIYEKNKKWEASFNRVYEQKSKYEEGRLAGKNCMLFYYSNALLVVEYNENSKFRNFIDKKEQNIQEFKKKGEDHCTYALSLYTRLKKNCPEKIKGLEEDSFDLKLKEAFRKLTIDSTKIIPKGLDSMVNTDVKTVTKDPNEQENQAWQEALAQNTIQAYQNYLKQFPQGIYSTKAEIRINNLKAEQENQAWQEASAQNTIQAYQNYLKQFPQGSYSTEAKIRISNLKAEQENQAWHEASAQNTIQAYQNYLKQFPQGSHSKEAEIRISNLKAEQENQAWHEASAQNTIQAYQNYLKQFPQGSHSKEAEIRSRDLIKNQERQEAQEKERMEVETKIAKDYGKNVKLNPVTQKEWKKPAIERSQWQGEFYPKDELVHNYKGRYFEIDLQHAFKKEELYFEGGEYFMPASDFKEKYGLSIIAFVTEALNVLDESQKTSVKVFIRGSADVVGDDTFRGSLEESYYYDKIKVFPRKNSEAFFNVYETKDTPLQNFKNRHLPNLRANFLAEMIELYSDNQLVPIILDGEVTPNNDKMDRNAIIYLFIPEKIYKE